MLWPVPAQTASKLRWGIHFGGSRFHVKRVEEYRSLPSVGCHATSHQGQSISGHVPKLNTSHAPHAVAIKPVMAGVDVEFQIYIVLLRVE